MTRESLRLEHADKILVGLELAVAAGYEVVFRAGRVTVRKPGEVGFTIVREALRDAAGNALQSVLNDLATEALEKAEEDTDPKYYSRGRALPRVGT